MQGYQQGNYSVGNKEWHMFTLLRSLIFYLLEDVVILINLAMSYKLQLFLEMFEVLWCCYVTRCSLKCTTPRMTFFFGITIFLYHNYLSLFIWNMIHSTFPADSFQFKILGSGNRVILAILVQLLTIWTSF